MKKTTKKNKKVTNFVLLKSKTELFELQEFDDFMNMTHPNRDEIREDVEYPTEKFPLSKLKKNVVSVPYVFKSKDKHKPKEVEIAYFKSKTKIQTTTEKEWIEKSLNQFFYCVIRRSTFVVEENSDKFIPIL